MTEGQGLHRAHPCATVGIGPVGAMNSHRNLEWVAARFEGDAPLRRICTKMVRPHGPQVNPFRTPPVSRSAACRCPEGKQVKLATALSTPDNRAPWSPEYRIADTPLQTDHGGCWPQGQGDDEYPDNRGLSRQQGGAEGLHGGSGGSMTGGNA